MEAGAPTGRRVLLSTVSSDSHTWNLVFLQLLLEEHGYAVTNLGPCVPDELLLAAARDGQPDAIILSSVNGHGRMDGARVIRALRQDPRTRALPAMIGGKLGIRGGADEGYVRELLDAGFDAVFTDATDVDALPGVLARLAGRPAGALPTRG